jgi:hypothetical protein
MSIGDSKVLHPKNRFQHKAFLTGILIVSLGLIFLGYVWLRNRSAEPREAPEAESVLSAQMELPFQVLIPAFLPANFIREKAQINTDKVGPQGEPMVQIIYPTRHGDTLTFYEWLPTNEGTDGRKPYCMCLCMSRENCNFVELGMSVGSLRLLAKVSDPNILSGEEARTILDTLGPAVNRQIYSSLKAVPVTYSVPPAVDVPINADGVQELTLVVTPNGYSPAHFAVQKGIPVKLIFRQTGQVGCGNELVFQWGNGKTATLTLASASDIQTLEFTPDEAGDFRFNCPHLIYRGVLTVQE